MPSLSEARKLVAQYNRETERIADLEARLLRLYERRSETSKAAFAALPDDYGITMHRSEPWEIEGPFKR